MQAGAARKLEALRLRLAEVDRLPSSEDATRELDNYRKLTRERSETLPVVESYEQYRRVADDVATARELLTEFWRIATLAC